MRLNFTICGDYYSSFLGTTIAYHYVRCKKPVNAHYGKIAANSYVSFYNIYKQKTEEINADLFFCDYLLNHPCFDLAWKLGKPADGISSDLSAIPISLSLIPSANSPLHQKIGPVMPDTFPSLTPVLESFLVDHPRTIYFALGTNVVTIDTSDSLELANSSVPLAAILNNEHPHVHISKFSPQFAILSHENTKLLSHGG
ncbi:UDP-Glycosyltransferase/glycogen phosphorylase [Gigaspora margarita]|uniref:UDP-Glycosyltransferase/glycogen phosphorylase n=1 Tax=Gigaspora margarita TaxID=4874 RepID=A0A8H4A3M9_GIGMA|nr:UDP-Glycosyltransferase/glycogen phosphorylase [Gigaspora margarita]